MEINCTWLLKEPIMKLFVYSSKMTFTRHEDDLCISKSFFSDMDIGILQNFLKVYPHVGWNISSIDYDKVEIHIFKTDKYEPTETNV